VERGAWDIVRYHWDDTILYCILYVYVYIYVLYPLVINHGNEKSPVNDHVHACTWERHL